MRTAPSVILGAAAVLLLAGCAAGAPPEDPGTGPDGGGVADDPCVVGTWALDVADYGAQSEAYLLGLGIPIEGYEMTGAGAITFTADGLVAAEVSLRSTGTIVAGEHRVPLDIPSAYTASGDWAVGTAPDTIDFANWANVPDPSVPVDPEAPAAPAIDYTDVPTVSAPCTPDELVLQGPDAPLSTRWVRE